MGLSSIDSFFPLSQKRILNCQTPTVHPAMRSKGLRDRERVGRCRIINGAHTPQRASAELLKGVPAEALKIILLGRWFGFHGSNLHTFVFSPIRFEPQYHTMKEFGPAERQPEAAKNKKEGEWVNWRMVELS